MPTTYLICATQRSGSTLLCEGLKATGVAGRPEEYFEAAAATGRPPRPEEFLRGLDDHEGRALLERAPAPAAPPYSSLVDVRDYGEHLRRVREWGTTPNGVFGAKVMWNQLADVQALAGRPLPPLALLEKLFDSPRLIWVRRFDVVRQAVSLWRALQTQSWRDGDAPASSPPPPRYSFPALRHLVAGLTEDDARWAEVLAVARTPVLEVTYEELATDLPGALERALAHIGVARPVAWPPPVPPMRQQADELTETWVAAYARDLEPLPTAT